MTDYNYEIERTMAKYGGEADKGVERTCGNCFSYNARSNTCTHIDNIFKTNFYSPQQEGCHCHSTHAEQKRLKAIFDGRRLLAEQKRIEDNRKNGTGECSRCPFRKEDNAPITNFRRITRSPHALAMLFARKMDIPIRCHFCAKETCHAPSHREDYSYCQQHIREWLEKEAK